MRHFAANALTFLIVALVLIFGLVVWGQNTYRGPGPLTEPLILEVERGAGLGSVAQQLAESGAIAHPGLFRVAARYTEMDGGLRFGEYEIPAGASMEEILQLLNRGSNIVRQIIVPEGFTSWQVVELLKARPELTGEIAAVPPEGSLAPAGYDFQRGDTRQSILDRMAARQQEIVAEAWETRAPDLPLVSPEELLILASIVEKETGVAEERGVVAGVFANRLERGMRLQTDPTVIYGITGRRGLAGPGIAGERTRDAHGLQHLCHRRSAADADRQSRRGGDPGGGQSGGDGVYLLRGRWHRRPCLRGRSRDSQRQCGGLAAHRGRAGPRGA